MNSIFTEVYPNPFSDQLTVQLNNSNSEYILKLFSDDGKLILEKRVADSTTLLTLDVSIVASGVYFLSVENSESKVVKRVVKN